MYPQWVKVVWTGGRKGRLLWRERGLEGSVEDGSVVGWWGGWGWREGRRDGGTEGEKRRRQSSMSCFTDSNLTAIREGWVRDLQAWGGGSGVVMFGGGVMVVLGWYMLPLSHKALWVSVYVCVCVCVHTHTPQRVCVSILLHSTTFNCLLASIASLSSFALLHFSLSLSLPSLYLLLQSPLFSWWSWCHCTFQCLAALQGLPLIWQCHGDPSSFSHSFHNLILFL